MLLQKIDVAHLPSLPARQRPTWLSTRSIRDEALHHLLDETYKAFDAGLLIFSAVGVRTTLDRASELFGVEPALTFEEKLGEMLRQGRIGETEKMHLAVLIDAGSAAAHRGWVPEHEAVNAMIGTLEGLIERHFIAERDLQILKGQVPAKPRRSKTRGRSDTVLEHALKNVNIGSESES